VSHFQHEHPYSELHEIRSPREAEVLQLLAKGLLYKEIAGQLSLSTGTVVGGNIFDTPEPNTNRHRQVWNFC
jgi:ATP/maltotriose-dependent transcriptional regulator MalT